jgi:hypothetical protein
VRADAEEQERPGDCLPILLVEDDRPVALEMEALEELSPDDGRFGGVFV